MRLIVETQDWQHRVHGLTVTEVEIGLLVICAIPVDIIVSIMSQLTLLTSFASVCP